MRTQTPAEKALSRLLEVIDSHEIHGEDCDRRGTMVCSCWTKAVDAAQKELDKLSASPRFDNVFCSQCGIEFGPGNQGFSHCGNHATQCANCIHGLETERRDHVYCNNPESAWFDGPTEATGKCQFFKLNTL